MDDKTKEITKPEAVKIPVVIISQESQKEFREKYERWN